MIFSEQFYQSEKKGYLNEEFRLFHIKDQTGQEFSYHYHDFHKVVIFLSGKVTYHIEGKAYHLKPWDILLVSRHAIHNPRLMHPCPMSALSSGSKTIFPISSFCNASRKPATEVIIWYV